jgi:hypothetical protein
MTGVSVELSVLWKIEWTSLERSRGEMEDLSASTPYKVKVGERNGLD